MNNCGSAVKGFRTVVLAIFVGGVLLAVALVSLSWASVKSVSAANGADPNRGKELFDKRCGGCHSLDADKEGPRLRNVYGRRSGTISTFKYSPALKAGTMQWDANSLDKWLTNTESVVPDNDMDFRVAKPDERADIIEYLREMAGR